MIVRCKGCDSAFAVDDAKITNKKFAFTCPKCTVENIIDNRASIKEAVEPAPAKPAVGKTAAGAGAAVAGAALYSQTAESKPSVPPSNDAEFNLPDENALIDDMDFDSSEKKEMDFSETTLPDENEELIIPELDEAADLPEFDDSSLADIDNLDLDFDSEPEAAGKTEIQEDESEDFVSFDDSGDVETSVSNGELGADIESKLLAADDIIPDNFDLPEIDNLGTDSSLPVQDELDDFSDLPVYDEKAIDSELTQSSNLEEINLDVDNLSASDNVSDIADDFLPLDENEISAESGKSKDKPEDSFEDFDIPEVIESDQKDEIKSEDIYKKTDLDDSDDDITIDLDDLDIELEDDSDSLISSEVLEYSDAPSAIDDSTETLDLDSLDIDLDDAGSVSTGEKIGDDFTGFEDEQIDQKPEVSSSGNDETLDLDSLDIPLEESGEFKKGEEVDDDKLRLTLDDAGLTMDELSMVSVDENLVNDEDDDELRLTIDEVDPSLGMIGTETLEQDFKEAESVLSGSSEMQSFSAGSAAADYNGKSDSSTKLMIDEIDDLPEIELEDDISDFSPVEDDFDKRISSLNSEESSNINGIGVAAAAGAVGAAAIAAGTISKSRRKNDALELGSDAINDEVFELKEETDTVGIYPAKKERQIDYKGSVSFSIDYSLFYSKIGALIRIFFIYFIGLLPHYLVAMLYTALSFILGFINNIVVISTGESVEDFAEIQENTLRYLLSISASGIGLVEENPIFTGRKNIDFPLQMDIVYPIRSSRFIGMIRASFIGIILIALPHILITAVLSIIVPIASISGQIAVLITGKWPRILFEFITSYYRYLARVYSFVIGLIDEYPPFKF